MCEHNVDINQKTENLKKNQKEILEMKSKINEIFTRGIKGSF